VGIERPAVTVGEAEVDKTIEVLRKQRTRYEGVDRAAANADAVVIDYAGSIDGTPFDGGAAQGQSIVLGEGRLLPDFEAALIGMRAGESKSFDLVFPDDYHGADVAGKKAVFEVTLHKVQEQILPAVDAEFAKTLGVEDGSLERMRADVRANLEREVKRRVQARVKDQALKTLLETSTLEVPKALIDMEIERLMSQMAENLRGRGMKPEQMNMPREAFEPEAKRRVSIGLVLNELVRQKGIKAQPDQVKTLILEYAESYERPDEVVQWYYQSGERVREVEAVVLENNVVDWVLANAKVLDKATPFEELMGNTQ
jgi:trigger factor